MTTDKSEEAARQLLDAYSKLVSMTAQELANGNGADYLRETVEGLTEAQAKSLLIARATVEAVQCTEIVQQLDPEASTESLDREVFGGKPTLH